MGIFRRRRRARDHSEALRAEVARLREQLDTLCQQRDAYEIRVTRLAEQLVRIHHNAHAAAALAGRMDTLDGRLTVLGTELTNQLTELSHEIDHAMANAESPQAMAEIETMRDIQQRMIIEQARTDAAVREDLTILAERLRKATPHP